MDGKECCFLWSRDERSKRFCSRPLSGSRTATIGIVAWFRFCRPILVVGRYIGFAVVMAQVRRPVPFRTRKLRPGRGDGTALERVWESSTPPLHTLGLPVEPLAPGRPLFVSGVPVELTLRKPHFLSPNLLFLLPVLPADPMRVPGRAFLFPVFPSSFRDSRGAWLPGTPSFHP